MVFTVKEFVKSQDIDVEALCSQLDAELVKRVRQVLAYSIGQP